VQAVLLAGHVIVNVVASAFFAAVEPVSLSHSCIHSDEVTTVDLDSGREQVGVTQGRPELNPAGTSAGTRLWKIHKPYSSNWLGLEAGVGIERSLRRQSASNILIARRVLPLFYRGFKHFLLLSANYRTYPATYPFPTQLLKKSLKVSLKVFRADS
jgi:hypothetical protein